MQLKLALKASAGSGKTFALSVRYIALILSGAKPSKTLALTFTNKAANEMKERVFSTFLELEKKPNELKSLEELLKLNKQQILTKRNALEEEFLSSNLKIQTIDSFFAQILRKFSLHLGIMPDFKANESIYKEHLQDEFISRIYENTSLYKSFIYFCLMKNIKFDRIFETLEQIYEKKSQINFQLENISFPNETKVLEKAREIEQMLKAAGASSTAIKMFSFEDITAVLDSTAITKDTLNYRTFSKVFTQELEDKFQKLRELARKYHIQREKLILNQLFSLYEIYESSRLFLARAKNELSFLDITNFVHTLLYEKIDKDFLYFRLDSKIEHILIDEFQDTSVTQYQILFPLIEEIISGLGANDKIGSFFYVGDTKQSIYRFRGGMKELFDDVSKNLDIKVENLDTNYRSEKFIVDFVNETFLPKMKDYVPQKTLSNKTNGGYVEVINTDDVVSGAVSAFEKLYAKGIKDEVAILCWQNKDAKMIEAVLGEKFKDISLSTEANLSLIHIKEIRAILEYAKFCYFKDSLYLANANTLLGLKWDDESLKTDINLAKKPIEILENIIKILKINSTDKNIIKLLEISCDFNDIESFLYNFENLNTKAVTKSGQGVRILTIFKAKGLQFEHVIVLDRLSGASNSSLPLMFDYEGSNLLKIYYTSKNREFVDNEYKKAKDKLKKQKEEDNLNIQYVAFTRAQNSLFIISKKEKSIFENLSLPEFSKGIITSKPPAQEKPKIVQNLTLAPFFGNQEKLDKTQQDIDLKAVHFGIALHYVLEVMPDFTLVSLGQIWDIFLSKFKLSLTNEQLNSIQTRVAKLTENKQFLELIKGGKVLKEQPIMYQNEKKQLDLMVEFEDRVLIFDYKSSSEFSHSHKEQVLFYQEAISKIYPKKQVNSYIIYLKEQESEIFCL